MSFASVADMALAIGKLQGLIGSVDLERVLTFTLPGTPIPKDRPRFDRRSGLVYTPRKTRDAEQDMAWMFIRARGRRPAFADSVAVVALFFVPTRQNKDLDNLLKLVLDAGNQAEVWKDDRRVRALSAWIELDPEHPRTVVAVAPCLCSLSQYPLLTGTGAI